MVLKEKDRGVLSTVASRVLRVVQVRVDLNTVDRIATVEKVTVTAAPTTGLDQKLVMVVPKADVHRDLRSEDLVMADLAAKMVIVRDLLVEKVGLKVIVDRAARKAKVARSVAKLR